MSTDAVNVDSGRWSAADVVAGYLSALAIFASVAALVWHPLRLIPFGILLALVASGMAKQSRRLALAAVLITAACFFLGMTIAVLADRPLW